VYNPPLLMVPAALEPPATPLTLHATAVFVVPDTVAVNCCVLPAATVAVRGETVTEILAAEGGGAGGFPEFTSVEVAPPPHP
jgi:hypothetical protein